MELLQRTITSLYTNHAQWLTTFDETDIEKLSKLTLLLQACLKEMAAWSGASESNQAFVDHLTAVVSRIGLYSPLFRCFSPSSSSSCLLFAAPRMPLLGESTTYTSDDDDEDD